MTNVPKTIREMLNQNFSIHTVKTVNSQVSKDGTIKNVFQLHDGNIVEGVLIPTQTRMTACVSSQVGCSLTCAFCATGRLKRIRNLGADEIYDQVVIIKKQAENKYRIPLSNIVYMGMGEPLLNYKNVLASIEKITSPDGLGMSPQRITVSTAGIAKMIKKLGDDKVKFNFALSLHAANDAKRSKIMPIHEQNSLKALADALKYFYEKTGTRVTYEYITFKDFNDDITDAMELEKFCRIVPCKVNIIEYNPIDSTEKKSNAINDIEFKQTTHTRLQKFTNYLRSKGIIVNVRKSRGKDIDAACGQLANKRIEDKIKAEY
jgi:23S rRNA (adenine2503-C2)-methyltransferase